MGLRMDSPLWSKPHHLYRLFASDGRLLYLGVTHDLIERFRHHERDKEWWPEVARHETARYPNRRLALAVEVLAISREQPIYNVAYGTRPPRTFAASGR